VSEIDKNIIFESLIREAIEEEEISSDDCYPQHVISGSGWGWFLDPQQMQMVRAQRGIEIIPVSTAIDYEDRVLVAQSSRILLIPISEVLEVGWN
jgi:hypothetical protein|tara:strand:- start:511 stop:795 length:285 start_codon:yes stop_codon:yes gene_type:complete